MRLRDFAFNSRIWFVLTLTALLLLVSQAQAASSPQPLTQWAYRYNDTLVTVNDVPAWLASNSSDWTVTDSPSNPPGRNGQQHLWLKTTLPAGDWHEPVVYITSIDLLARVYLDGELIYQHGRMDATGQGAFSGWPWHEILLPPQSSGKTLAFEIYSDYTSIGLWGQIQVMERSNVFKQVVHASAQALAVSALVLVLGALATLVALIGPDRRGFAAIALFAYASGLMLIAESPARQLLYGNPLVWDTLRAGSYFTLPIALGLLLSHWLTGRAKGFIQKLWRLHLVYLVAAMGAVGFGFIPLPITFPAFDVLLLITLPLMLLVAYMGFFRLALEQRFLVLSTTLFAFLLILDMLVAHNVISWRDVPLSIGLLGFTLANAAIFLWHYRRTQHQLAQSNETLELQVANRTEELDQLVAELRGLSYKDPLTGLRNRRYFNTMFERESHRARDTGKPLTLLMIDIDHFKRVNDRYGHDAGDAVLIDIAKTLKHHFFEIDIICRFGGEEFVVVLPDSPAETAQESAYSLLATVAQKTIEIQGEDPFHVTLSCGVASYPDDMSTPSTLLRLADQALYEAKRSGRNRCVRWSGDSEAEAPPTFSPQNPG